MAVEKAYLQTETGTRIDCLFNPESISVSRGNNWTPDTPAPGKGVGQLYYSGANSGTMSLTLMFDTTDTGTAVTRYTGAIMGLLDIDPNLPNSDPDKSRGRPPWATFNWGDLHSFKAVLTSANLSFTYFSSSGTPLRATIDIGLTQYEPSNAFGPQNPTSGTPRPHRVHRVQPGETLDRISARYYGDSTKWRVLASVNGVEDPLALRPGLLLNVPRSEGT